MFKSELEEAQYNLELLQSTIDEAIYIIELLCSKNDDESHYHAYVTAAEFIEKYKPKPAQENIEPSKNCHICGEPLNGNASCPDIDCIPF